MTSARQAVIVGWGHTKFGKLDGISLEQLIHKAAREALDDAGIAASEVDAVWLGHFNSGLVPDSFCSSMILSVDPALRFKPATRCENACASGSAAILSALDAIASGRVRVALVVGAEKMTVLDSAGITRSLAGASYQHEEAGMTFPQIFAEYTKAYIAEHGDPTLALAHIAVKNHANAMRNPLAQMQRPLDIEFCSTISDKNPVIAAPLKLSDCSLVSDGAAAVVIVHKDLIHNFRRAVGFRAFEQVNDVLPLSAKRLTAFEGPHRAFLQAYAQAGITVEDLSVAEVHDCFTIAELLAVEALQLAPMGQAAAAVIDGISEITGKLPINVSGGLKAKGHPIGATGISMHVLIARQLVGEGGGMQITNAQLGATFNMGGGAVANAVSILEPLRA